MNDLILRSLQGRVTRSEERQVARWRAASPDNEDQYRRLAELWSASAVGTHGESLPPNPDEIVHQADVLDTVSAAAAGGKSGRTRPAGHDAGFTRSLGRAAAVVVLVGVGFGLASLWPEAPPRLVFDAREVVTGAGETATVSLQVGSVIRLAPHSRLQVHPSTERRAVTLAGRAFFAVAKQEGMPFQITTNAGTMTVLGTRFDVLAEEDDLQLVVVEGRVVLASGDTRSEVGAGEMARIVNGTPLPTIRVPATDTIVGWVGDFLAFQSTALSTAAEEIERRYGVRINIANPDLGRRTVTGWFSGWDLDDVLTVVCTIAEVDCNREGSVITVQPLQ